MLQIRKYTPADKAQWDKFVETSRNGTFLFRRDFMDYHADRFADHSSSPKTSAAGWPSCPPTPPAPRSTPIRASPTAVSCSRPVQERAA